jgi:hypothetical protein
MQTFAPRSRFQEKLLDAMEDEEAPFALATAGLY